MMRGFFTALALFACTALPAAAGSNDAYQAVEKLISTKTTILGETIQYPTSGPAKVSAVIVTITPGADTVMHRHPAPMFAYILEGEVTVDYGASGKRTYRPGEGFVEAMNVAHRGTNTGTVPVRILAVSMGAEGTADTAVEK